jgi:serine/threonine-protein kinase HipA
MVEVAEVKMYSRVVGYVKWDNQYDLAAFEYDKEFLNLGIEPAPIMMPVKEGRIYRFGDLGKDTFKGLPGMLADSLPDTYGRALFDKWLTITGNVSSNSIESLCFMGKRCMGALEFEPAITKQSEGNSQIEIQSLINVAKEALNEKSNFKTNLSDDQKTAIAEILRLGTSAGGQRAKAIIAYNKATGEIRSGQVDAPAGFDHYIIKLDGVSSKLELKETGNYGRLEYSFSELAKLCNIQMTECSLIEENGRAHFMTKRFDRNGGKKIHLQTLCGIAHYDYRLFHAYSYEQAFSVMRTLRLSYEEAQEMFKRMVFNIVIRNNDDHTKNISFLMDEDGKWRLSPAYDIVYAYNPNGKWTSHHQMSINGKFDKITKTDLLECAYKNNIKNAQQIIGEVCDAASKWNKIAQECDIPKTIINNIIPNLQLNL